MIGLLYPGIIYFRWQWGHMLMDRWVYQELSIAPFFGLPTLRTPTFESSGSCWIHLIPEKCSWTVLHFQAHLTGSLRLHHNCSHEVNWLIPYIFMASRLRVLGQIMSKVFYQFEYNVISLILLCSPKLSQSLTVFLSERDTEMDSGRERRRNFSCLIGPL